METALITGSPLSQRHVSVLEALGYSVINGSEAAQAKLGRDDIKREMSEQDLVEILPSVSVYIYGGLEPATRTALLGADKLKLIAFLGTGWADPGCVEPAAAADLGLTVSNTAHANARSTAEMAITMMLAVERQIEPMNRSMFSGRKEPIRRRDLLGRALGVVGAGHVGGDVARIAASGLGMEIFYSSPSRKSVLEAETGATLIELDELCSRSDFISIHAPAAESLGLVSSELVAKFKSDAILVNTAAPEIVDGHALLARLRAAELRGVGMDGMYADPELADEFRALDDGRLLLTPRAAWLTDDSYDRMAQMALESVADLKAGVRSVRHQVAPSA